MSSSSASEDPWNLQGIIDYFRSDKEIAEAISEEEFAEFFNYDKPWISLLQNALKYQGFDHKVIISQLVKNRASYIARKPDDLKWEVSSTGHGHKSYYTNKETLARDINYLITVFLIHHNGQINKIIKEASGSVKGILSMLKDKYVIKDSGTSLGPRDITLPRIGRAFPCVCVKQFHKNAAPELVRYETFPGCQKPETHAICCPILQSVCPFSLKAADKNNFHPVMLWVQIKQDDIIHKKGGNKTSIINILNYYRAAYMSTATPENARLKIFSNLGIIIPIQEEEICSSQKWKLTDNAAQLAGNCLSDLENMRKEDGHHVLLMELATSGSF